MLFLNQLYTLPLPPEWREHNLLNSGKTPDATSIKYTRNIFMWVSAYNINIKVVHVPGKPNQVSHLFLRWPVTKNNIQRLCQIVHPVFGDNTYYDLLYLDESISMYLVLLYSQVLSHWTCICLSWQLPDCQMPFLNQKRGLM